MKALFLLFISIFFCITTGFGQDTSSSDTASFPSRPSEVAVALLEENELNNWQIVSKDQFQLTIIPCTQIVPDTIKVFDVAQKRFLTMSNKSAFIIDLAAKQSSYDSEIRIIFKLKKPIAIPGILKRVSFWFYSNKSITTLNLLIEDTYVFPINSLFSFV